MFRKGKRFYICGVALVVLVIFFFSSFRLEDSDVIAVSRNDTHREDTETGNEVTPVDCNIQCLKSKELLATPPPVKRKNLRRGYKLLQLEGDDEFLSKDFQQLFERMGMHYNSIKITDTFKQEDLNSIGIQVDKWKTLQEKFFEAHKDNQDVIDASGFVCTHYTHCSLFFPFNKPIFAIQDSRPHAYPTSDKENVKAWLNMLIEMDNNPDVIFGSTNLYDALYYNHFTGSRKIFNLPSTGFHVTEKYNPTNAEILIGPYKLSEGGLKIADDIQKEALKSKSKYTFSTINRVFSQEKPNRLELSTYKAIVLLPSDIHSHEMLEMRAMNIPLLLPSFKLLAQWQKDYHILNEKSPNGGFGLPAHARSLSAGFDPNNDKSIKDLNHWLQFADYYQWPIVSYDSIPQLLQLVETTDFAALSRKLGSFNKRQEDDLINRWEFAFLTVFDNSPPQGHALPPTYQEGLLIWEQKTAKSNWRGTLKTSPAEKSEKWVVITSINYPTDQVKTMAAQPGWRVVIVGDKKTPKDWHWDNCDYLDASMQEELGYRITKVLPWDHYTRKNVGYLWAIQHGAKVIMDCDDDNVIAGTSIHHLPEVVDISMFKTDFHLVNPYHYFGQSDTWPRGFPVEEIRKPCATSYDIVKQKQVKIPIQQGLADHDPDVDAIHRLTNPLPFYFKDKEPVALSRGTITPFNSQNTVYHYSAFWGLLIPKTTTFRVCDIWRGYWVQRVLWEIGGHLSFLNATAIQVRNPHDYLLDFEDELDLYLSAGKLVKYLNQWIPNKTDSLFDIILKLHQDMAAAGFWHRNEVQLTHAWLLDLIEVGYKMPTIDAPYSLNCS